MKDEKTITISLNREQLDLLLPLMWKVAAQCLKVDNRSAVVAREVADKIETGMDIVFGVSGAHHWFPN